MNPPAFCPLEDLGVVRFRGPDTSRFLQGQLSNDITALAPGTLLRAGLHNPQGRTLALLTLLGGTDEQLAAVPRELLDEVIHGLRRYVLRAKVTIDDASTAWRHYGVLPPPGSSVASPDEYPYQGERTLKVLPATAAAPAGGALSRERWRALDIAAGLPQVYRPTAGQFVAQMLNLDCIGAISFQKGCYTGQEVIARAHYRGRVKRRMQRFVTESADAALQLAPGDIGHFSDGRAYRVVEAARRDDQRIELLAVTTLPGGESEPESSIADTPAKPGAGSAQGVLQVSALPLPYPLPD